MKVLGKKHFSDMYEHRGTHTYNVFDGRVSLLEDVRNMFCYNKPIKKVVAPYLKAAAYSFACPIKLQFMKPFLLFKNNNRSIRKRALANGGNGT